MHEILLIAGRSVVYDIRLSHYSMYVYVHVDLGHGIWEAN